MKIIDLAQNSNEFAERYIKEYCGGRNIVTPKTNLGFKDIKGLTFVDPEATGYFKTYKVIICFFNDGIGLYFRNFFRNKLILIKKDQIKSIEIEKNVDIIRPFTFSLYSLLSRAGVGHSTAASYLTPREIIKEEAANCTFRTEDHFFNFLIEKTTPEKLVSQLKESNLAHLVQKNIHSPQILSK